MFQKIILFAVIIFIPFFLNAETIIAVIGDSNSSDNRYISQDHECWSSFLQKELSEYDVKVVNWSIPGANFLQGCWMIGNVIRNDRADIVIITLGLNDILQNTPLEHCALYLTKLFDDCLENHSTILLGKTDASYFKNKKTEYTENFTGLYDTFADTYKVTLFDFITCEDLLNAEDHIHPGKEWHKKIAKKISELIMVP
jgi:lysophospholipase L1-like esterase